MDQLPLVHIVGVTSIGTTFTIALAFISDESEETYYWVLKCLVRLFRFYRIPLRFVWCTDRCWGVIKAGKRLFPGKHILCFWHVCKNIEKKIKELRFDNPIEKRLVFVVLKALLLTNSEEEYVKRWIEFEQNTLSRETWRYTKSVVDVSDIEKAIDAVFARYQSDSAIRLIVSAEKHEELSNYVEATWLRNWKECIVRCYTDQHLHRG